MKKRLLKAVQKGRVYGTRLDQKLRSKRSIGIQVLECGYVTKEQLESIRLVLKRAAKKKYTLKIWKRIHPFRTFTKKPQETRMGKGKGSKKRMQAVKVRKGKILVELLGKKRKILNTNVVFRALRNALHRLPLKARVLRFRI